MPQLNSAARLAAAELLQHTSIAPNRNIVSSSRTHTGSTKSSVSGDRAIECTFQHLAAPAA
ncbi:hypothetical protein [Microcoleus sp. herbarium2]|uniref:hypothetical protein n=1 Tax=Microcoleus sp. herbarium2 TaxID=3055433 RepID=UPI002FD61987